jgi:Fe-S-cluster-containing hydrogenase component 2
MNSNAELAALKDRAQEIGARLEGLQRRIQEIQDGSSAGVYVAVVDTGSCIGCGFCQRVCPVQAIEVKDTALVDEKRCIGCGRCVQECPRGAVTLRGAYKRHGARL